MMSEDAYEIEAKQLGTQIVPYDESVQVKVSILIFCYMQISVIFLYII